MCKRVVMFLFLFLFVMMSFGFATAVITGSITGSAVEDTEGVDAVPVVEGECPEDCWLNNMGSCTCPEDEYEKPDDVYAGCGAIDCEIGFHCEYGQCVEDEIADAGITPDSAFYFIDDFFDRFGDKLKNREEKVAEIRAMVEAGNYEAAKKALKRYKKHAEELEQEIEPEKLEAAKESSEAIEETLREIENDIPEDYKTELYDDILEKEGNLLTAVEIADKIRGLCFELSELDPVQYSEMCTFGGGEAKWKRNMHKKLSKEQEKEAKEFGQIMKQCFETSGNNCRCEDISFYDFSVACSKVAPLASKCDAGSEDACRMMDEIDMPILPDHLQDVFDDIERTFGEAKYGMHMPPECVEAGATSPRECSKIMIKEHAPIECRQALLDAECEEERECREICDKIMFEKHSPRECIEKGITNPEECGKFMDNYRGPGPDHFGPKMDCGGIQDPKKRLECYDGFRDDMGEHYGVGDKFREAEGEITWQCKEHRIHWPPDCEEFMRNELPRLQMEAEQEYREEWAEKDDWRIREKACIQSCGNKPWTMDNGVCKCGQEGQYYSPERGFYDESECKDGCSQECPGASRTDCINEKCECFYDDNYQNNYQDDYQDRYPTQDDGCQCYDDCGNPTYYDYSCNCPMPPACNTEGDNYYADDYEPPQSYPDSSGGDYIPPEDGTPYTPDNEAIPGPADGGPSEPEYPEPVSEPEPEPSPEPASEPEHSAPITGEVISNKFLKYWWFGR